MRVVVDLGSVRVSRDPTPRHHTLLPTLQVRAQGGDEVLRVDADLHEDVEGLELRGERGDGHQAAVPCDWWGVGLCDGGGW